MQITFIRNDKHKWNKTNERPNDTVIMSWDVMMVTIDLSCDLIARIQMIKLFYLPKEQKAKQNKTSIKWEVKIKSTKVK